MHARRGNRFLLGFICIQSNSDVAAWTADKKRCFLWLFFVPPYSETEGFIMTVSQMWTHSVCEMTKWLLQHFKVLFFLLSLRRLYYRNGWHRQNVTTHNYEHLCPAAAKPIKCNYYGARARQETCTIMWRQAKASAAAGSAMFSLEWNIGSPPALTTAHKYRV